VKSNTNDIIKPCSKPSTAQKQLQYHALSKTQVIWAFRRGVLSRGITSRGHLVHFTPIQTLKYFLQENLSLDVQGDLKTEIQMNFL